jgi:single-stranded DNA-specific DHH superfamily exonuclease
MYLTNLDKVVQCIHDVVHDNGNIIVYGDYDVDGLMFMEIFREMFNYLEYDNVLYYNYTTRTHAVDKGLLSFSIINKASLVIIGDTGSSDLEVLKYLTRRGIFVIVIDHHETEHTFRSFSDNGVLIINNILDRNINGVRLEACGATLGFLVADCVLKGLAGYDVGALASLAITAMYADCVNMDTLYARSLYSLASSRKYLPMCLDLFLGERQVFCRRFCEYTFSPKVNASFRMERFDLINNLFLNYNSSTALAYLNGMKENHVSCSSKVAELSEILLNDRNTFMSEFENCVLVNLTPLLLNYNNPKFIINSKGQVANVICSKLGKAVFCVCDIGTGVSGSLRDQMSRDVLRYFAPLYVAGGHPSAFGFTLGYDEWSSFLKTVGKVDSKLALQTPDRYVVRDFGYRELDSHICYNIAEENEFASYTKPIGIVKLYVTRSRERIWDNGGYSTYSYEYIPGIYFDSKERLRFPKFVYLRPYIGNSVKYEVLPENEVRSL